MDHTFGAVSKIFCLTQLYKDFLLFFFLEVSGFTFRSIIHFSLNSVCGVRYR